MTQIAKKQTMANFLVMPQTTKFLDETLKGKKTEFVSNLLALTDSDANLQKCDPGQLLKCAMNATALNLPLNKNLGYAYVIPYGNVPQFQIGYKGLIQLAIRTGAYKFLNACEIREGEIDRNKITGEINFIGDKPDNKIVGYLAFLELNTGFKASMYMSEAEIEAHAMRFSKMYQYDKKNNNNSSKWSDALARPKMAIKTVLKLLLGTYGVMTTDMVIAFDKDSNHENDSYSNRNIEEAEVIPQQEPNKTVEI